METRHEAIDLGITRLRRAARAAAAHRADPEALIGEVVARMPPSPDDDTALLAIHLP